MSKMIIIAICFILGLALVAWGIRLMLYRHPADYTEGTVTIATSSSVSASSTADQKTAPTSTPRATPEEDTLTVEGQVFHIDVADTVEKRAQGLSGREPLGEREGMLFIFPYSGSYGFWMKDMKFDLDMVWIAGDTVIGVTANVPAPAPGASMAQLQNYYPPSPIDKVLEINAGSAPKYGINAGDRVKIVIPALHLSGALGEGGNAGI